MCKHNFPSCRYAAAAAAKSFQSCLTLCDPIGGSPPGCPVPGILQARTLEWAAISFSNAWKWKVKVMQVYPRTNITKESSNKNSCSTTFSKVVSGAEIYMQCGFHIYSLLGKWMATHSSILAWGIPWTEKPGRLHTVHGVAKSRTRLKRLSKQVTTSVLKET